MTFIEPASLAPSFFFDGKLTTVLSDTRHIKLHVRCFLSRNDWHLVKRISEAKIESATGDEPDDTERSIHPNKVWVLRNGRKRDTYRSCDTDREPEQGRDQGAQASKSVSISQNMDR